MQKIKERYFLKNLGCCVLSDSLFMAMCKVPWVYLLFPQTLTEETEKLNQNIMVNMLTRSHAAYVLRVLLHL